MRNITKNLHWQANPFAYMARAKERARATLQERNPALTALERGYREAFLKDLQS